MGGGCTGGKNKDCTQGGGSYSHQLLCCTFDGVSYETNYAFQATGDFGQTIACPYGYVIQGMCASGENKDCTENGGGQVSHYIDCVPYSS